MDTASNPRFSVEGTVASGVGRGAQFLAIDWVRQQIMDKVGINALPGTLNLRISEQVWGHIYARRLSFVRIADPASDSCPGFLRRVVLRSTGRLSASAFLILPELTMYKDVLEVIAAENLREILLLKDGSVVQIEEAAEP